MLKIITNPNPILRQRSKKVTNIFSSKIQRLVPDMITTMMKNDGVGLAAPQIGKNIRLIVLSYEDETLVMFNPRLVKKSIFKEWGEEGCLSVPETYGDVKRHKKIVMEYQDEACETKTLKAKGLLSRIIQHEIDHLDAILFIDKAKNVHHEETLDI